MTRLPIGLALLVSLGGMSAAGDAEPADVLALPEPSRAGDVSVEEALERRRSIRSFSAAPLALDVIGQLAWAVQGVTDDTRGYRSAPSAGATYPLEIDLLLHGVDGVADGIYRYLPEQHALRLRLEGDHREPVTRAALGQAWIRDAPVTMVISAVIARTAARYGERAERYVHMEAGHAAQNVYLQAVALDVGTVVIGAFDDAAVAAAVQLGAGEQPLYILPLGRAR